MIPLIESNKWRRPKRPDELEETAPEKEEKLPVKDGQAKDDIDSQAVKELLQGTWYDFCCRLGQSLLLLLHEE